MNILTEVKKMDEYLRGLPIPKDPKECQEMVKYLGEKKEELINKGFNVSFMPSGVNLKDLSKKEAAEIKKQMKEFRYINYLKKNTLRRIDYAIAAYKIAEIGLQTETFKRIIEILPYNGDIVGRVSKGGYYAAKSYFQIYELLSGDVIQRGISVEIMIPEENGFRRERIQLYKTRDIAKYVHENYGPNVQILKTKIITKHRSILSSRSLRKVLAAAYAYIGSKKEVKIEVSEMVKKYHDILKRYGIKELIRVDATLSELDENMLEEMYKEGLIEYGPEETIILNEELNLELTKNVNKIHWETLKEAYRALLTDMMEYYIKTHKSQRKTLGGFVFDDDLELLRPIAEKAGILGIVRAYEMIKDKARLEEHGFIEPAYGYAVFAYYQGKERLKRVFGVDANTIEKEYKIVKEILDRNEGDRADEFLRNLRG